MTYAVTKHHVKGFLEGMDTRELTGVKFEVGKDYGNYICTFCKEVTDEDSIVVIGSKFGVEKAYAVCTYEYAQRVAKDWRSHCGYDVHMYLQDLQEGEGI